MLFLTYLFFEFDFQSTAIAGGLDYLELHNFIFAWLIAIFFLLVKIILLMVYFYYFLRLFYLLPVIIFYCRIYQNSFYKKLINIVRQKDTAVMLCFIPTWLILIVIAGGVYSYLTNPPDLEGPGPSSNYAEELLSSASDLKPKGTQNETTEIGTQTEVPSAACAKRIQHVLDNISIDTIYSYVHFDPVTRQCHYEFTIDNTYVHLHTRPEKDGVEQYYFVTEEGKFAINSTNTGFVRI